ncbi:cation diffusion facilitator family transporter [Halorientalis sp.]|jgi:cation diffusion facilitator family transporter|uniref:cation diffusion facilitator family transporter n=1 Tax=Halorientalis sp. TaxID=1931229 RepID=UPI00262008C1|nr:cation diffusion facilitator family transporter [Halorientalis sp.]
MARSTALRRVGLVVLGANVLLALAKGGVWYVTGSLAVGSEAVNSLADTVYSVVIVAGLYLTTRPPDFEHPHGHERIEPFVGLFVALGIFAAGAAVIWQALTAVLSGPTPTTSSPAAVAVLVVAAVAKFLLYRYCQAAGENYRSPALVATALDNRNDILTAVAALGGVVGAALGFPLLDPVAATLVGVGILYTGVEVVRDNLDYLVGAAPPEDLRAEIVRRALAHPDVEGAHDVIAHYVGPEIDVSLHIEVEGTRTLLEAHNIETAVIGSIQELSEVDDVFVHIDPKEAGEWKPDEEVDRLTDHGPNPDGRS